MSIVVRYCAECPRRFGMARRELIIALSQRIHEHRPPPGPWPEDRAGYAFLAEFVATDELCVEAGAEDAA